MPIVTLTTDFGSADIYTGQFKGHLLSAIPSVNIIDITHHIPTFNIVTGAYSLKHTYKHFPQGSIHIARIYEKGIEKEDILVAYKNGHYFLAPDNGLLPLALGNKFSWIYHIDIDKFENINANRIYAFLTKLLVDNIVPDTYAKPGHNYVVKTEWSVNKFENIVRGIVVIVDHFGNLVTNIHMEDVRPYVERFDNIEIQYRHKESITRIDHYYNDVEEGERMARFNDEGLLEISINGGRASKLLGIKFGDFVNVIFS